MTIRRRLTRLSGATLVVALLAASTTALLASGGAVATAASSNTISLTAGEYTYQIKGSPKPGWLQWNFANSGVEDHMMIVFPVKPGTTDKQVTAAVEKGTDEAFGALVAGDPVTGTPGVLGPKMKTTTLSEVKAGTYVVLCFIAAPDGKEHVAHGMHKIIQIKGSKSSFKPPSDGVADVTLTDTAIEVPSGNPPKNVTVKFTNEGTTPHSFQLVKLAAGKTLDDANAYYSADTPPAGVESPGVLAGGVQSIAPGGIAYLTWSLTPGHYGYVSTDSDDSGDDYSRGLKGEFDIS